MAGAAGPSGRGGGRTLSMLSMPSPSAVDRVHHVEHQSDNQARLEDLADELESLDEQIKSLQATRQLLIAEQRKLQSQSKTGNGLASANVSGPSTNQRHHAGATTNYFTKQFPWTSQLLPRAQKVWKIANFRSVQEAVCNAALDGRDTVCIMPTGAGKSLCYQLPALFSPGLTLVVSPLISLSMDQMWHLREAGVPCEMLYSAATREETNDILRRVKTGAAHEDIKVLFVTPERVAKSKTLLAALQKCYERDRLSRIVIDEAHCCSHMGHDFRPDYKNLSILRKIFPEVPFLCLSATLSPSVLEDVRKILTLPRVVDPAAAPAQGTVYFTAPLHRPNLRYQVIDRPSAAKDANEAITEYILANHPGKCGIVYTLSKADTQRMADALNEISRGKIRASVYHADLTDELKTSIHHRWRQGSLDVVVATIAFGMGIDKGDVRFVLHASLGKSLDSYYQETGRAGRDGKNADCVLFFRPADATRMSGMLAGDPRGQEKLHSMLSYAQSSKCRKSLFADYFADQYGGATTCGTCDNCLLPIAPSDVTSEAWKIIKVMEEVYEESGRITLAGLGDLCRGLGQGQYSVVDSRQRKRKRQNTKAKQSGFINIAEVVGEKVKLSKDDTERVLVELLLNGYLADEYNATAYSVNVYVKPGPMFARLSRLSLQQIQDQAKGIPTILVKLLDPGSKRSTKRKSKKAVQGMTVDSDSNEEGEEDAASLPGGSNRPSTSRVKNHPARSPWTSKVQIDDEVFSEEEEIVVDDKDDKKNDEDVYDETQTWQADVSSSSNRWNPIEIDSD